ncbi:hypothetical protein [Enterococcus phage vB_Efs19_KEN07]
MFKDIMRTIRGKTLLSVVRRSVCGSSANHITTLNH